MEKLFSYGTLQLESVQIATFGRRLVGVRDTLLGYRRSEITITDESVIRKSGLKVHPILQYTGRSEDEVDGVVFAVTADELAAADTYEVKEYVRQRGTFKSGGSAWIYAEAARPETPGRESSP